MDLASFWVGLHDTTQFRSRAFGLFGFLLTNDMVEKYVVDWKVPSGCTKLMEKVPRFLTLQRLQYL